MDKDDIFEEAVENYEEIPSEEYAELYVVLNVKNELFIRSTDIYIENDWMAFGNAVVDWTSVELKWHLEDNAIPVKEQKQIIPSLKADLFRIDTEANILFPFSEKEYSRPPADNRMFAYISTDADEKIIEKSLRSRMQETGSREFTGPFGIHWRTG